MDTQLHPSWIVRWINYPFPKWYFCFTYNYTSPFVLQHTICSSIIDYADAKHDCLCPCTVNIVSILVAPLDTTKVYLLCLIHRLSDMSKWYRIRYHWKCSCNSPAQGKYEMHFIAPIYALLMTLQCFCYVIRTLDCIYWSCRDSLG